ncbi:MAG: T9SS type A sorting domain-containing protein [bacterium]|nr:T9SS type A sorting domain-containing protein [bacterium]
MTIKTYCLRFSVIAISLLLYCNAAAQNTPALADFNVFRIENSIYLRWTLTSGSICDGIQIYRSTDSTNFSQIGEIPGICGSSSEPRQYSFTDKNPVKNKTNYYRLAFGGGGVSEVLSIEIIDVQFGGIQIRPNPATGPVKIYFNNTYNQAFQLLVYNLNGQNILNLNTSEKFFQLDTENFSPGVYPFTIALLDGTSRKVLGKLVVQ